MSLDEMSDDIALAPDHTPTVDRTAVTIRRDMAQVESTLSEFDKVAAGLQELHDRFPVDLVYDCKSSKGMADAKAHRAAWRDPRITVEKCRKAGKAPVLALGKNIDARAAWLTEQLLVGETPIDEQIKAEEARQAKEKSDREAAEFGRVMAMQEAVGELAMSATVNGLPSVAIAARIDSLRTTPLDLAVYQEMMPQAEAARTAAIAKLEQALKAAQWDEAEAKRKADEADRLRAEQAAADAERARVSAEQAETQRRLDEAREMIAKAQRDAEAERQKLADERAAFLAEQEAAKPKPAPIAAPPAAPEPAAEAVAPVETLTALEATAPAAAQLLRESILAVRPPIEEPTLTLGMIKTWLAPLQITAEGLAQLGFPFEGTSGPSKLYLPSVWPAIKAALVKHIEGLAA